jgi:RNA polymerase sigma factor (sigma-70 family)
MGSEDILQGVVLDALSDLNRFEARGPGALSHYLHVCVPDKIRSKAEFFDAAKRRGTVALPESIAERMAGRATEAPDHVDREKYDRVEKAMSVLPEPVREVLILRKFEGLTNAEATEALGKSVEATAKIYSRVLARLTLLLQARMDVS